MQTTIALDRTLVAVNVDEIIHMMLETRGFTVIRD